MRDRLGRCQWVGFALVGVLAWGLCGCDSGGSSGGGAGAEGIELPAEISAIAAREDAGESIRVGKIGLAAALVTRRASVLGAVEDLPEDSDYHNVQVRKFVEVEVLDVFEIIDTIFDAVRQTHYEDHVGDGWYKCLVSFKDEGEGGVTQTNLEEWYVRSQMSGTVNRVEFKILELDEGELELARVRVDIEEAPTENEDGTLADLGVWEVRALFGDQGEGDDFFHATAAITEEGLALLTVQDQFTEDMDGMGGDPIPAGTRGVVYRSLDEGYGVAEYPDWDACWGPEGFDEETCGDAIPTVTVEFSYNENYLSVQLEGEDPLSFDRTDEHEIVHRYMLFDGETGSNVQNELSFGFSVRPTADGDNRFGWYGAWQDRHQLWVPGDSLENGTEVRRNDVPPGEEAPTYTTRHFDGALTEINLVEGSLDQLEGIAAEIWLFDSFRLRWNDAQSRWDQCMGDDGMGGCETTQDYTDNLEGLATTGEADQRHVYMDHCGDDGMGGWECTQFVYQSGEGAGFYEATMNEETGQWEAGDPLDTDAIDDGYEIWVNVGGRTYIQYVADFDGDPTSTGWVEKTLTDFDEQSWTPVFDEEGDREFNFEVNRQYFVNNRGANLRVTRVAEDGDAEDYQVFMEVQQVAKPSDDLGEVYPEGTVLVQPWDPDSQSTYSLNVDPEDENYLLLEYETVSENDAASGISEGDVVESDIWGLRIEGDETNLEEATIYNWEFQEEFDHHGGVTYLIDEDDEFVLLSDPLRFQPIALAQTNDIVQGNPEEEWLQYSLMYDGWLHGLPDSWFELEKVEFEGEQIPDILAKNIRIPDGTELTAEDESTYLVKAVDVGIFLGFIDAFPEGEEPDMTLADDIDLDTAMPNFVAPNLSDTLPTDAELLYIEGIAVE